MRFQCVQCDHVFEGEGDRPRCPQCLRVHGIRQLDEGQASPGSRRGAQVGAALAVVVAVAGLGYFALRGGDEAGAGTDRAVDALAERGVDAGGLSQLLAADAALVELAKGARGKSAGAAAELIVGRIRERAKALAFAPWPMVDPRSEGPMTAAETWAAMQRDGARHKLYPLEVAAVAVAALRAAQIDAKLVEILEHADDKSPVDPSGCIGYFGLSVAEGGAPGVVFDPYRGRGQAPAASATLPLTDAQALAAALGLRALHGVAWAATPAAALKDIEAALRLHPEAPYLRSAHAVVLSDGGGLVEAEKALEDAAALRPDAARKNNLAVYRLQRGDAEAAGRFVTEALSLRPDYAAARVTLAGVHMAKRENAQGYAELKKAEALDPALPTLPLAWAQYHATEGDMDSAIRFAEQGAALRPMSPHLQLNLGRLYRIAGRYDDMRRAARKALSLASGSRERDVRQLIELMLGPTALESAEDEPGEPTGAGPGAEPTAADPGTTLPGLSDDALDVGKGSRFLDADEP